MNLMKEGQPTHKDLLVQINIQEQKMTKMRHFLYYFVNRIYQEIVRFQNKEQLFKDICDIAIDAGKFKMA